jgi:hypothetical protein
MDSTHTCLYYLGEQGAYTDHRYTPTVMSVIAHLQTKLSPSHATTSIKYAKP